MPRTKPTLIKDAKIWMGLHNGMQVLEVNILLEKDLLIVMIYSFFLILSYLGTSATMPRPDNFHDPAYHMVP